MNWTEFSSCIRHFPVEDQGLVQKAFEMGKKAHEGQVRQSGEPYFTHPIAVARILADMTADRDTIIAALLHDTVEDTALTLGEIEKEFGTETATLIDGATKMEEGDIANRPSLDEKIETLRKMFTLMQKDVRIMVIKLADRLHNMRTIGFRQELKQKAVAKETIDIYVKIADRLCMRDIRDELELLCRQILEPDLSTSLIELQRRNHELAESKIKEIHERIALMSPAFPIDPEFENNSYEKLRLQHELQQDTPSMRAAVNVAFRCLDIDGCYRTLGVLHREWPREALTFEDFINLPVINGYKGLHTTLIMEDGTRVRCKIRTYEMDEYAHRGITTMCFDSQSHGVQQYLLPWTHRISPLASDTKDHSSAFWETLQSDILSESILIYGPTGTSILVPSSATALDAALYLFADKSTRLTSIRVNGKQVPFSHRMEPASTVEIATGSKPTIHRDWLYLAQTGFGIAMIREEIAKLSNGNLQEVGKNILQQELTDRGAGYVEEFDKELIRQSVLSLGYDTLEDAYVAIANRYLEPSDVIAALENVSRRSRKMPSSGQRQQCTFFFMIDRDVSSLRKLLTVYERYNLTMDNIRLRLGNSKQLRMKVNLSLTSAEQESYRQELIAAGALNITMKQTMKLELALMAIVVIFWALNPVWARFFIESGISPLTLVSLRSIIFFIFSTALFLSWRYLRSGAYSAIPRAHILAFAPAVSTFLLSYLTYLSISLLPPSVHLAILRFNILLLPIALYLFNRKNGAVRPDLMPKLVILACLAGLFFISSVQSLGVIYALIALSMYVYYSLITERTLQIHKIGVRYPYFLFYVGMILGMMGLALLPWLINRADFWLPFLPNIGLYVFFCVFVPHTSFHIILQRVRFKHVTSMSMFEVPLAIMFEVLLLGIALQPSLYAIVALMMGAIILALKWSEARKKIYKANELFQYFT